jgi:protein MAK11
MAPLASKPKNNAAGALSTSQSKPQSTKAQPTKKARLDETAPNQKAKLAPSSKVDTALARGPSVISKGKSRATLSDTTVNLNPASKRAVPAPLPKSFKVIAGSYEKLLYGIRGSIHLDPSSSTGFGVKLNPQFIFPAHVSSVKAVGASPEGG